MKIFDRGAFPVLAWADLDGKTGTILIARDGDKALVAFHENNGGIYILAWLSSEVK